MTTATATAPVEPQLKMPTVSRIRITPAMATNWLENANSRNRPVSQSAVERYARDMRSGCWRLTHQGIAFDPNGVILDGQHRLWAIVYADVPVEMHVWFNVPPESRMVIDGGRGRNLADHLRLGGGLGEVNKEVLAALRCMMGKGTDLRLTADEAREALRRHERPLMFAIKNLPRLATGRGITACDTRAVVARAWYSADEARLQEFCEVLCTSLARRESDKSVVMLRNYLSGGTGWDRQERRGRYGRIERAVLAYLRDETLTRLNGATQELFPLPEETH